MERLWCGARSVRIAVIALLFAFILVCIFGEVYFRYIYLQTDYFNFSRLSRRWYSVCWQPQSVNGNLTYRDRKWTAADVQNKIRVMLVGDSLVAGHGVCDPEARTSAVLQKLIGTRYAVFNLADAGWDTPEHLAALQDYPYKPDVVVLSYVLDDIGKAMKRVYGAGNVQFDIPSSGNFLIDQSYLFDYIYWQLVYRQDFIASMQRGERNNIRVYSDAAIWTIHATEMQSLIDWTKAQGARLIVFTWPYLTLPTESEPPLRRVEAFFRERGAEVLSGLDLFAPDDAERWTLSEVDPHPNAEADRRVAEALFKQLMTDPKRPAP